MIARPVRADFTSHAEMDYLQWEAGSTFKWLLSNSGLAGEALSTKPLSVGPLQMEEAHRIERHCKLDQVNMSCSRTGLHIAPISVRRIAIEGAVWKNALTNTSGTPTSGNRSCMVRCPTRTGSAGGQMATLNPSCLERQLRIEV